MELRNSEFQIYIIVLISNTNIFEFILLAQHDHVTYYVFPHSEMTKLPFQSKILGSRRKTCQNLKKFAA